MAATIYVTKEAWANMQAIKDLDYSSRCAMADDGSADPSQMPGYYLKNANKLNVAILPADAHIAMHLHPSDGATYFQHVSTPINLRGCVFEKAPHLPNRYAEIASWWSGETVNTNAGGAAYYQCPGNSYMVDLSALDANPDLAIEGCSTPEVDALVTEGVVVCITGLGRRLKHCNAENFVEVVLAIDESMVGLDNGNFRSDKSYSLLPTDRAERIFLKVADIFASPDSDHIYLDALRYESLDYGFHY